MRRSSSADARGATPPRCAMFTPRMPDPLAPHTATPEELRERIDAERAGAPFLVLRDGAGAQRIVSLADDRPERLSIGRNPSNDVSLPWDEEVSRLHAELERIGGEWTVSDDGLSRNGTFVNGSRIGGGGGPPRRRPPPPGGARATPPRPPPAPAPGPP